MHSTSLAMIDFVEKDQYSSHDKGEYSIDTFLGEAKGFKTGGGHGGALDSATPQKNLTNTASLQEKSTKHCHRNNYF